MSSTYHYNSDSYASGLENIVAQTYWSIHFSHVPTGRATFFEAFLTDFTDNFSSNWNTQTVFGRMDPIATFQNTQRTIKFGFKTIKCGFRTIEFGLKSIQFGLKTIEF